MRSILIPLIVSLYLTCVVFFMVNIAYFFVYIYYGMVLINIILIFINILYSIINKKELTPIIYKETMIFKIVLIPYFIFNFIMGIIIVFMGIASILTIFFFASLPLIFISFLVGVASYMVVLASSSYNVVLLIKETKKKTAIFNIIMIILNFIFIADVIASVITYVNNYKKEEILNE